MAVTLRQALRRVLSGGGVRVVAIPVTGVLGMVNSGLIIANTGSVAYGLVNTVATLGALVPFADLGMGAAVTTAVAQALDDPSRRAHAVATIRAAVLRLCMIMAGGLVLVWGLSLGGAWSVLLGRDLARSDQVLVGLALSLFLITLPLGLGARTLVGLDRMHVVVALNVTATGWALVCTLALMLGRAPGSAYAISGFAGNLVSNALLALVAAIMLRRRGWWAQAGDSLVSGGLLAGSGWMLLVMLGLPVGLETGRLVLAHRSAAEELSRFALGAQLYALAWSVLATSGQALWAVFARQRAEASANVRLWRQMMALFGAAAVIGGGCLVALGPWLGLVISRGVLHLSLVQMIAFAGLLLVQALHLPGGVLLTRPEELRWQAMCILGMAAISMIIAITLAPRFGGPAVTFGATAGVVLAQLLPDLVMVPRLLHRRPEIIRQTA